MISKNSKQKRPDRLEKLTEQQKQFRKPIEDDVAEIYKNWYEERNLEKNSIYDEERTRNALIIVDLQNDFCEPSGTL